VPRHAQPMLASRPGRPDRCAKQYPEDGVDAYGAIAAKCPNISLVGRLTYARRKFHEAHTAPGKQRNAGKAKQVTSPSATCATWSPRRIRESGEIEAGQASA